MPTVRVPPGIVRGESKAMIPGRYWDGNLIRWQGNVLKPVGGWERNNASPLLSVPRNGHVWNDTEFNQHRAIICDAHVYRVFNGVYTDITPADFADANSTSARGFGSGNFGLKNFGKDAEDRGSGLGATDPKRPIYFGLDNWADELLFGSSADGRIWVWDPATPATPPAVAVNAPTLIQSFLVTDEHHLMVCGMAGFPNRIAWSGQNNRTDWDYTAVTGSAGFFDLEGAGFVYCARKVPGAILIFTASGVWIARYIGAPYYYGFTKLSDGGAPISPHSIAVAGNRAIWPGKNSFWQYQAGAISTLSCDLGLDPFESWDTRAAPRRVTGGFNGAYPEMWFFYPSKQDDMAPVAVENDRYVIYNFENGWWADGYLSRSFFNAAPLDGVPFAGDDGYVYQHEIGYKAEGASRQGLVFAEIGNISFDDGMSNWQINQFQIDSAEGPDSVKFIFRGRRTRGGPEVDLQTCVPRIDGRVNASFTARDFSMRIEGMVDAPWSVGALVFDKIVKRGQ
jgi:hypothetical protein